MGTTDHHQLSISIMNSPPDPKDEVHVEPADLGLIDVDGNLGHLDQQRAYLHHMRRHCHGDW